MDQATHNKIVSFIWGIADDVLRDLFVRGKYRDVILPMCVLRRLDAVLEPTKQAVLDTKEMLDNAGITEQRAALCGATYAICKADMLLKGEGENADHVVGGAEWSTLSHDAFPAREFDFMLSNPPYGKSWKKDLESMGGKDGMRDPRFKVILAVEKEAEGLLGEIVGGKPHG